METKQEKRRTGRRESSDQFEHNPLVGLVHGVFAVGLLIVALVFTHGQQAQGANAPKLTPSVQTEQVQR